MGSYGKRIKKPRDPNREQPYKMFSQVEAERFVDVWQRADSPADVAALFEVPISVVYSMASRLRAGGVPLKKFKRGAKYDVPSLVALAKAAADEDK